MNFGMLCVFVCGSTILLPLKHLSSIVVSLGSSRYSGLEFKKWRHDFDDDRRRIQTSSVTIDIPERRRYSILWRYYVKGQKTFNSME